ncbi:MAG: enoyl-CoA hydratase/isomerase family protein [Alphaproteobacteria bacterium]|nr:enoyl-CoA hydratase/isomerase family protein [Alphaproteobacteria bacterium]
MTETSDIRFAVEGGIAFVTLARPRALNALTLEMIRAFYARLVPWSKDPAIRALVIEGEGDRAFCAGGDVRAVYDSVKASPSDLNRVFFWEEYKLNRLIHRLGKPYVALVDGITFGGGLGLSVHGTHRIATERTLAGMPETGIGLFPDIGATWFLNRCPGKMGLYLALTGARVRAADALYVGFATHYAPSASLDGLKRDLVAGTDVDAAIRKIAADPGPAPLSEHRAAVDRLFSGNSVEEILTALAADGSDWAQATLKDLRTKSPTSMKVTFEQLRRGAGLAIEEVLIMEFRMTQTFMAGHDFFEGIRALLVDKDQSPKWQPPTLAEVTPAEVGRYFQPLGANDLRFD